MIYSKCIALGKHRYTKPVTRFAFVHIKADLLHSQKRTLQSILSRKHSKYNYTVVKIHILHILLYHHIGKRTNTLLPPFLLLSLSLLLTQFLCSSVWEKGKKERGNSTWPFPPTPTPHTMQELTTEPSQKNRLDYVLWVVRCNVLYKNICMGIFISLPDSSNF